MSWGRVGRTVKSSAVTVPGVTGTYAALDAVGTPFEIPMAIGAEGSVITQLNIVDRASAMSGLRAHFYTNTAGIVNIADNAAWALPSADDNSYLGFINIANTDWVTAGITGAITAMMAQVINQNIGIYNPSGNNRSIYCQLQAMAALTFGGMNTSLRMWLMSMQD